MNTINDIFIELENLIKFDSANNQLIDAKEIVCTGDSEVTITCSIQLKDLIHNIINNIDKLFEILKADETILISVKNQKVLRTCFDIITSLGISNCLIPGVGIGLDKRCSKFKCFCVRNDDEKYELLTCCTDFLIRCYSISILKSIILTLYLSDYLAALIQLSFAPIKKPGIYTNYTMTEEKYSDLLHDKHKYVAIYENFVTNCYQSIIMKELLVLQGVRDPPTPNFVRRMVSKELSNRLLATDGLLSLTRCFIESYEVDTGFDWKKIDMICKIVSVKHGNLTEAQYLNNICLQISKIIYSNNTQYVITSSSCLLSLYKKYFLSYTVSELISEIFNQFSIDNLKKKAGSEVIMSKEEVEQYINILYINICIAKLDWASELWTHNMYILLLLGTKCTSIELKDKIKNILIKCLEDTNDNPIDLLLFGIKPNINISIENNEGLLIKGSNNKVLYSRDLAFSLFVEIIKSCSQKVMKHIFDLCLKNIMDMTDKRSKSAEPKINESTLINNIDEDSVTLQLLIELSTSPKFISYLKDDPDVVLEFIEHFLLKNSEQDNDCMTIALVLFNTILSDKNLKAYSKRFEAIVPTLKDISNKDNCNSILCKEALSLINDERPEVNTPYCEAINDVYNELLPVRAHGIIQLTKLLDEGNKEAVANKHRIFCLLQEQLRHNDSYIYLAAINGIVALSNHCTEDVLHLLCKEFLNVSDDHLKTNEDLNNIAEVRLKVGDVIVKVTKQLGDKVLAHKTILLNTMLSACRDHDPLVRTSALSNLAEIVRVMNYKMGTIIYEVLNCIWSILATDKAIECRRAAVMIITSLFKGLGRHTLVKLKTNLLPIYRALKCLYKDPKEDCVVKLHAQLALEELNEIVAEFLTPALKPEFMAVLMDD